MKNSRYFPCSRTLACMLGAVALCAAAFTAQAHADHAAGGAAHAGMNHAADATASDATRAFEQGEEKMMKDMRRPFSGNADKDFVAHMIPHHEGAVSMAQVQLKYGKDPELRKMAGDIIRAQQREIAFMKKWQARQGGK